MNSFMNVNLCVDRANVYTGKKEDRMMMTGVHTVFDIYCVKCGSYVGWRYVRRKTSNVSFFFWPLPLLI